MRRLPFLLALCIGCSSAPSQSTQDLGLLDANPADTAQPTDATATRTDGAIDLATADLTTITAIDLATHNDLSSNDSSTIDSSTLDSSTVDSSTVDSNTIDSNTIDSNTIDSNTIDSNTIDSSTALVTPPDLSTLDASPDLLPANHGPDLLFVVDVVTHHNDNQRTGANTREHVLTTANLDWTQFGKLGAIPVTGQVYAQPLYLSALAQPDGTFRDVLFVATEHNLLYAFDAEPPFALLWQRSDLGTPLVQSQEFPGCVDLTPEVGITSTPVIDRASNTLYVVVKSKDAGVYHTQLHAIDVVTGAEKPGSPVEITATMPGTGAGQVGGVLTFDPLKHLGRPALLLSNGVVYMAFASHCDIAPYHGWVLGYDAATLQRVFVFNPTPNGDDGGIWQSGEGLSAGDDGSIYTITGNGTFDANAGGVDYGDTFLRLDPGTATVLDWFTPYNQAQLDAVDNDLGTTGALLIPGTHVLVGGSKAGWLYVLDTTYMGHFQTSSDSQALQTFQGGPSHINASPIYYDGPAGKTVYSWGASDTLKAFNFNGTDLDTTPASQSSVAAPAKQYEPGGFLSLSADGKRVGSGVVWASLPVALNPNHVAVPGFLAAFDAANVGRELWSSLQDAERDDYGNLAKFCPPTVAQGKVYMATFSNQIVVYGPLPPEPPVPAPFFAMDIGVMGLHGASTTRGTGNLLVRGAGNDLSGTADSFHFVAAPQNGDGAITAQILSQENTDGAARAGLAIRASLSPNAAEVALVISPSNTLLLITRDAIGATATATTQPASLPLWLRLERSAGTITASTSTDGALWQTVDAGADTLPAQSYAGVAVTSHVFARVSNVLISNLTLE